MRKSKKLIALLCAMVMVFSVFGAFTVANAENAGIVFEQQMAADGKSAVVTAKYVGLDKVTAYTIKTKFDPAVVKSVTAENKLTGAGVQTKYYNDVDATDSKYGNFNHVASAGEALALEDNILAVFTLTFADVLTEPLTFTLRDGSRVSEMIETNTEYEVGWDEHPMDATSVTIPAYVPPTEEPATPDPNATATPTPKPTIDVQRPTPKPTKAPEASVEPDPTQVPIEDGKGGIVFESVTADDNKSAVVTAKYVGLEKVTAYTIKLKMDPTIVTSVVAENKLTGAGVQTKYYNDVDATDSKYGNFNHVASAGEALALEDNILAVFTLTFASELQAPMTLTLRDGSRVSEMIETNTEYEVGWDEHPMPATFAYIKPNTTVVTPEPGETLAPADKEVTFGDYLTDAQDKFIADNEAKDQYSVWFDVKFFDKDGKDVTGDMVYGRDFSATWKGEELTKDEYEQLLAGYAPDGSQVKASDIAKNLKLGYYNNATVKPASVKVTAIVDGSNYEDNGETGTGDPGVTPTPTATTQATTKPTATPGGSGTGNGGGPGGNVFWGSSDGGPGGSNIYGGPTSGTTPGGVSGTQFTDVDPVRHAWAVPAINYLVAKGVVCGRTPQLFDPDATVTRAEFTKMVVGAIGLAPAGVPSFADAANHWAASFIATAEQRGIVTGYTADQFAPDKKISRQEMAAIVYRAATAAGKALPAGTLAFADANMIDDYATAPCAALQAAGIIQGVGNNMFDPLGNATRAQSAVIVYNYMTK